MYKLFIKRSIDLLLSLLLLPFFLLVYLVLAILIKLDDGGPVLYCGERLGMELKKFKMYKFRSMMINAPDIRNEDGSTYNSISDQRLTRVGRVLRKLSLDEIPQLLNVVKGDMSFIGPRPSPVGNIDLYNKEYLRKFSLRPGITGYSQAYFRNIISIKEKQKMDLYYIDNMSFNLDFKIIIVTGLTVLKQKGVYSTNKRSEDLPQ